ncbi:hypothetical protein [Bradyrhizobium sp. USDA 329]|uniref:hypothetical protein n=1 Tax=unclassified Bradyrhizobium TaxID=2631580 RepID=UPI0035137D40
MLEIIRASFPGFVALRTLNDMDKYDDAVEAFARGGSRRDLMACLFGLGIPADQIRTLASYPGTRLPAAWGE